MIRLGLKTDSRDHLHWVKNRCRSALAWVNMVNAQEMMVGVVMGELTHPNLYYVLMATLLAIQQGQIIQIGNLAFFVAEEKQHSLVQTSSSFIPENCVRKKWQVLEGKGGRARE